MRGRVILMKSSGFWLERDSFERMAAEATQHRVLLLVGAGKARQPFAVRELGGEIFGLAQFEVELRALLRDDVYVGRAIQVIADRADPQRILARLQLGCREGVV